MKQIIIGVMGPGKTATAIDLEYAYQLGQLIAKKGWVLLTGGRASGVMEAANQGAKSAQGLTVGILPTADKSGTSEAVDIPILTNLGNARNAINVLSSDVVIACGMGAGTASEVALAIKENKTVVLLNQTSESTAFFQQLAPQQVRIAKIPLEAIQIIQQKLSD
jgi:uncharacterized protein (TIGR00725 family)